MFLDYKEPLNIFLESSRLLDVKLLDTKLLCTKKLSVLYFTFKITFEEAFMLSWGKHYT